VKIAPVADVKARFSSYIDRTREGPVLVTKNGRPAALLVGVPEDDDELERFILAHTPRFRRLLEAAGRRIGKGSGLAQEEFWTVAARRRPRARRTTRGG
jgi:prevent-host-death family protein